MHITPFDPTVSLQSITELFYAIIRKAFIRLVLKSIIQLLLQSIIQAKVYLLQVGADS
jgi:hypothetical protein